MNAQSGYEVTPAVVPARRASTVSIRPRFEHARFPEAQQLALRCVPNDGLGRDGAKLGFGSYDPVPFTLDPDGTLRFNYPFGDEQEYTFVAVPLDPATGKDRGVKATISLYAVEADLLALRPFRGDTHMHSMRSDGSQAPAYVAATGRKAGLDFMALTDHRQYQPSLEVIAAMRGLATDLRCFPGEEVHEPEGVMHVVNFGGRASVNELLKADAARLEIAEIAGRWPGLNEASRLAAARTIWACRKIREAGGVAIYAHPYWRPCHRRHFPPAAHQLLMTERPFDAVEVMSAFSRAEWESNVLTIVDYYDACMRGGPLPVVAVTDSHNCDGEFFGAFHTIVLAKSSDFADLAEGIRGLNSVAVEAVKGAVPRVWGQLRQVRFVFFLLREYFPRHDAICEEEGEWMLAHFGGDPDAAGHVAALKGRVAGLQRRFWN